MLTHIFVFKHQHMTLAYLCREFFYFVTDFYTAAESQTGVSKVPHSRKQMPPNFEFFVAFTQNSSHMINSVVLVFVRCLKDKF